MNRCVRGCEHTFALCWENGQTCMWLDFVRLSLDKSSALAYRTTRAPTTKDIHVKNPRTCPSRNVHWCRNVLRQNLNFDENIVHRSIRTSIVTVDVLITHCADIELCFFEDALRIVDQQLHVELLCRCLFVLLLMNTSTSTRVSRWLRLSGQRTVDPQK